MPSLNGTATPWRRRTKVNPVFQSEAFSPVSIRANKTARAFQPAGLEKIDWMEDDKNTEAYTYTSSPKIQTKQRHLIECMPWYSKLVQSNFKEPGKWKLHDCNELETLSDDEWMSREAAVCAKFSRCINTILQKKSKDEQCATAIQSLHRGRRARKLYASKKATTAAVVKIQAVQRGHQVRGARLKEKQKKAELNAAKNLRNARKTGSMRSVMHSKDEEKRFRNDERDYAAVKLQAFQRGNKARQTYAKVKNRSKTVPLDRKHGSIRILTAQEARTKKIDSEEQRINILAEENGVNLDSILRDNTQDQQEFKDVMEWRLNSDTMEEKIFGVFRLLIQDDKLGANAAIPRNKIVDLIEASKTEIEQTLKNDPFLRSFILGPQLALCLEEKYGEMQLDISPSIVNELLTAKQAKAPVMEITSEHNNHAAIFAIDHEGQCKGSPSIDLKKARKKKKKKEKKKKEKKKKKHKKKKSNKKHKRDSENVPDGKPIDVNSGMKVEEKKDLKSNEPLSEKKEVGKTTHDVPDSKPIDVNSGMKVGEKRNSKSEKKQLSKEGKAIDVKADPKEEKFVIESDDPDFIDFEAELQWLEQCSVNDDATVEAIDKVIDSTEIYSSKTGGQSPMSVDESGIENHPEFENLMSGLESLERSLNEEYSKRFPEKVDHQ